MSVTVRVRPGSTRKVIQKLEQLRQISEEKAKECVMIAGINVQAGAKRRCPVDTGRLRASINVTYDIATKGYKVYVGTNVEYAKFVEYGTTRQPAQPYLIPAAEEEAPKFSKRVADALKKAR